MDSAAQRLADKTCLPCKAGTPALDPSAVQRLLTQLDGWQVAGGRRLAKTYRFDDFAQGLAFVNRIGAIADAQGHHPDIHLAWGAVAVEIWTHAVGGLTESDFILAAKCDRERARS